LKSVKLQYFIFYHRRNSPKSLNFQKKFIDKINERSHQQRTKQSVPQKKDKNKKKDKKSQTYFWNFPFFFSFFPLRLLSPLLSLSLSLLFKELVIQIKAEELRSHTRPTLLIEFIIAAVLKSTFFSLA